VEQVQTSDRLGLKCDSPTNSSAARICSQRKGRERKMRKNIAIYICCNYENELETWGSSSSGSRSCTNAPATSMSAGHLMNWKQMQQHLVLIHFPIGVMKKFTKIFYPFLLGICILKLIFRLVISELIKLVLKCWLDFDVQIDYANINPRLVECNKLLK